MMRNRLLISFVHLAGLFAGLVLSGCDGPGLPLDRLVPKQLSVGLTKRTWHDKFHWRASDYFSDPQVIELCHAIEDNDLQRMDALINDVVNVNALGRDNMTPLLWAYPDNKLSRFEKLLAAGADPNVLLGGNMGVKGGLRAEIAVTHLAAKTWFPGYFQAVMQHGGDPELPDWCGTMCLYLIITGQGSDKLDRIKAALEAGADINALDSSESTALMTAISFGGQYELALQMLELGADPKVYMKDSPRKAIHSLAVRSDNLHLDSPEQQDAFERLRVELAARGEHLADANADYARWDKLRLKYLGDPKGRERARQREWADIRKREQQEKNAPGEAEKE